MAGAPRSRSPTVITRPSTRRRSPLPGGGLEVCWQGRHEDRFAIFARRWSASQGWSSTARVSSGVEANVWDPSVACFADGGTAYAWSEYVDGAYRVVVRRRDAAGELGEPQSLTSEATTRCTPPRGDARPAAVVRVRPDHGGRSRRQRTDPPAARGGGRQRPRRGRRRTGGQRERPTRLLPDVSASVRVVAVTDHGVLEAPGRLAPALDVVPAGCPSSWPPTTAAWWSPTASTGGCP